MVEIYKENETIYMKDGDDIVECEKIVHENKTGKDWVVLPENSSNRKVVDLAKISETPIELKYRETRVVGPRGSKKDWREYLTEDERLELDQYEEGIVRLRAIADEKRRAEKETPLTELEKAQREVAKWQAKVARLTEAGE